MARAPEVDGDADGLEAAGADGRARGHEDRPENLDPREPARRACVCEWAQTKEIKAGTACKLYPHSQSIIASALTPHARPLHAAEPTPSQRTAQ